MRIVVLIFLILSACQTRQKAPSLPEFSQKFPSGVVLDKEHFQIFYSPERKIPLRVGYELTADMVRQKNAKRRDRFFADPELTQKKLPHALPTDYRHSGYDRGHMAPSEDFVFNQKANDGTFVMSNMVPQTPSLNRGPWAQLESAIRGWACGEEKLRIEVGPIIDPSMEKLPSGVEIPQRFYKVVLDKTKPTKSLAFVYSQEDSKVPYKERVMSVAALEKQIGVVFLETENISQNIKESFDISKWQEKDCRP